ncbi:hypothetical protein A4G99_04480 [Haladaptatus sp. R4]|nr:hypothetical protein A4G99_04480 [Haladaptatus sp. R4]
MDSALEIVQNPLFEPILVEHVAFELGRIQFQLLGIPPKVVVFERVLMLVEVVVHLPELSLHTGRLGRLRGVEGVWMGLFQREVSKDEPEVVAHLLPDRLDDRIRSATVGALVIPVFDQRDGCIRVPS